jgi:REP element-mobilizing transposase RayT
LARPLRIDYPGAWQHVMNRGAGQRSIFRDRRDRGMFLRLLADVTEIYRVEIHAYCLMGNHYHLLIRTPDGGLSPAMRHLNGVYTQRFNRSAETDGPLFRGRFRSVLVDADGYLLHVSRYIHLNPVDAGLVRRPEEYLWSSCRYYVRDGAAPWWLKTSFVLRQLGDDDAHLAYRSFLDSGGSEATDRFYGDNPPAPVIGRPAFRCRAERAASASSLSREVPSRRKIRSKPALEAILRAVSITFGKNEAELTRLTPGRHAGTGLARGVVVYLSRRMAGLAHSEIAGRLGYASYAGAASAMRRMEAARQNDASLRRSVDRAWDLVNRNET